MSEELKPCPFCGSEARFVEVSDTMGSMKLTAWKVQCSKCWCSPYPNNAHGDKNVVAQQWNTRAERTCHREEDQNNWGTMYNDWCSECNEHIKQGANYCPGCGAKVVDDE